MKVLFIFADMVRANRLKNCNSKIKSSTPLDDFFLESGGTLYSECFTPTPDTPRGIACLFSGLGPYQNGCDLRIKYPKFYLKTPSFFDLFLEKGYAINCFSNPSERKTGLFPKNINDLDIHNTNYNLDDYLKKIKLKNNHLLFLSIPDFHSAICDIGGTLKGEKEGYKQLLISFEIIFKNHQQENFDHIVIFSDHGFKFYDEWFDYKKNIPLLLNEDRTNALMFHKKKGDSSLEIDSRLISTTNLFGFTQKLLDNKNTLPLSLHDKSVQYIVGEDHLNFNTSMTQNIEIWYYIDTNLLYIRTLEQGYTFKRKINHYNKGINIDLDKKISSNTQFVDYIKRKKILNMYNISNKETKQKKYANGNLKNSKKTHSFIMKIKILFYILIRKIKLTYGK